MNLVPTAEQDELAEIAASFAESSFPISMLHSKSQDPAGDRPGWPEAARLGLFGLAVPDSSGGLGARSAEEVLVTHALGRVLAPPSLTATLLAAHAAHSCGSGVLRPLLDGRHVVGMGRPMNPGGMQIDGAQASGTAVVIRTRGCDAVLLTAGSRFALISADSLPVCAFGGMDSYADVSVHDLDRVEVIFSGDDPALAIRRILMLSALFGGIAESAASMSVSYVQQRQQFGRPIGAFQAIKHRCADMATRAEVARAATSYASVLFDEKDPTAFVTALAALHVASEGALTNARMNIQNHGGIGFTMDCDAHLHVRRAHVLIEMAGGRNEVLAGLLSAPSPLSACRPAAPPTRCGVWRTLIGRSSAANIGRNETILTEVRLLANCVVGLGFSRTAFELALEMQPDMVGCDAGTADSGPAFLGTGKDSKSSVAVTRDLDIMMDGTRRLNVPLVIGSCGGAGARPQMRSYLRIVEQLAAQTAMAAARSADRGRPAAGHCCMPRSTGVMSVPLGHERPLTHADVDGSERIVGMMGAGPIATAIEAGADIVLAGQMR